MTTDSPPPATVSDHLVERLRDWGVRRVFGYAGDGINGVLGALQRVGAHAAGGPIEFVQAAHEELAGMMAVAHAKFTGDVGVCLATSGPGAIHLLNGLYDAKLDHQPLVAIVGQQSQAGIGGDAQQETDLEALLQDVASAYCATVADPEQLRHVVDRALRIAIGERAVTAVIVPHDVQRLPAVPEPAHEHARQHSASGWARPRMLPRDADLERAAQVLAAGERIAILAGAGALAAGDALAAVAERLGAGVAKALLGKAALPDDLDCVTGSIGWLGTSASNRMMRSCDTLLIVGSNLPYTEFLPEPGQARGVQIDVAPRNLALRYPVEVPLAGDADETLRALLPRLAEPPPARREARARWRAQLDAWKREDAAGRDGPDPAPDASPIDPRPLVRMLSRRLPDRSVVTADSGTSAVWLARETTIRPGMLASLSGGLATMGCAIPYAIAAKFAYPDRFALALVGDGAMQMSGLSALVDVAKHWRVWRDPRLLVVVMNNRDLAYVTWEQRVMEGEPRYLASQALPDVPYAAFAKLLGLDGVRVERFDQVSDAIERALAADRPFVVDALVDPSVPTLPPSLEAGQREKLDRALDAEHARGDVAAADAVRRHLAGRHDAR
ncbi:MAG TPA: thiamine pyrophosphate-requiring protein [Burkholderiaceae bacterium]|nr:thiamine pyrophosphate-requiring protein [Burkholderiaceae bacterium]